MNLILYLITFFGLINLLRMTFLLVGSDLYSIKNKVRYRKQSSSINKLPTISVVIPAHNEKANVIKSIKSVLKNNYPQDKIQIIVVNDGSTDTTSESVQSFISTQKHKNVKLINQPNLGKAAALNSGIKNSHGTLVMCLDSDSELDKSALTNMIKYFEDKKVVALSSNVKIMPQYGLLNLIQQVEYLICYQMKRAQTFYNIEYIIGGIGSTFRKAYLKKVNYYDGNTVTEDIDLTMKILQAGNKKVKIMYASDVIAYTHSVLSVKDLIKQRYRWKWGRYQTFLKNYNMFFTTRNSFTKGLTWIYLPFAILGDFGFLLEPLFVIYIVAYSIISRDMFTLTAAFCIISFYNSMSVFSEDTLSTKRKIQYLLVIPSMYFLFYILSFVEYVALIKSIYNFPNLKKSLDINSYTWSPVKRSIKHESPNIAFETQYISMQKNVKFH